MHLPAVPGAFGMIQCKAPPPIPGVAIKRCRTFRHDARGPRRALELRQHGAACPAPGADDLTDRQLPIPPQVPVAETAVD